MIATLRASAERALFGATLADKLAPVSLADIARGSPVPVPAAPARPPGLAPSDARAAFPNDLGDARARARVLHFFANHELLAIELIALALLRFPDADAGWRRGLAAILAQEQDHLRGYLARLDAAGVAFGEQPLNRYFWSALSNARSPAAFAAGLALTFEQANLDFASLFAARFRQAGDADTAALLDRVLADEIEHVAHGVRWLRTWSPGTDLWTTWTALLEPPLTPARAKGPVYCRAARVAAGIPDAVIDRLSVYSASRGRPPVVGWFVPDLEGELAGGSRATAAQVGGDLATLPMYLLGRDDHVLAPEPDRAWLARVQEAGFVLPGFGEAVPARVGAWLPWGWSPAVCARTGVAWSPAWRDLYAKSWLQEAFGEGRVARSLAELDALGGPGCVLKAPFATAGRGNKRWERPDRPGWAARVLAEQGAIVVERWEARALDLSVQFDVRGPDDVTVHPWARFHVDAEGRYRGACVGRVWDGAEPPGLRRWMHARDLQAELRAAVLPVARAMAARGFRGPAGVDAYIAVDGSGFRLRPLVELNPRVTMGRIAQAVARHVRRERPATLRMVTAGAVRAAGLQPEAWCAELRAGAPVRVHAGLIEHGVLPLTEPRADRRVWAVLEVGEGVSALPPALPR